MNKLNTQKKILKVQLDPFFEEGGTLSALDYSIVTKINEIVEYLNNDQVQSNRKHSPLSKSKGVKREKKKGVGSGEETTCKHIWSEAIVSDSWRGRGCLKCGILRPVGFVKGESKR